VPPLARDYWPTVDWRVAAAEEHGLDREVLARTTAFAVHTEPPVNGYVVVRHGYIVFEEYYGGFSERSYHNVYSVTKSITSALIGTALKQGLLESVDQRLVELFPEHPVDDRLTLRHLMSMTAGFSEESLDMQRVLASDDPLGVLLARPVVHAPGSVFFYDDGGVHLLSILLTRLSGVSAAEFALRYLFEPLGIWQAPADPQARHSFDAQSAWPATGLLWQADRRGHNVGGYGLHLTLRDMAKVGYLYLNSGRWDDGTVLSREYVEDSTREHNGGGRFGGSPPGPTNPYALLWWRSHRNRLHFSADGFGGQQIMVLPDTDMVIAMASSPRNSPWMTPYRFFIPAVRDE
jgi:CubicO group peptidase (beta-lactamase class C family)